MRITKRSVDTKRHNQMWKVAGKWRRTKEVVSLARDGKVDGITICHGPTTTYVRSLPSHKNLNDLPYVLSSTLRRR